MLPDAASARPAAMRPFYQMALDAYVSCTKRLNKAMVICKLRPRRPLNDGAGTQPMGRSSGESLRTTT